MTQLTADIVERKKANETRKAFERRDTKSAIQSAREKLTSSSGLDRSFEIETFKLFANSKISACFTLGVYTALIAFSLTLWVPPHFTLLWCFASCGSLVLSALLAKRFLSLKPQEIDEPNTIKQWRRNFSFLELSQSVIWSTIGLASFTTPKMALSIFIIVALIIYASAASSLASSYKRAVTICLLPILLMILLVSYNQRKMELTIFALLGAGAIIFSLVLAYKAHDMTLQTMGFRAEKEALFAALQEANAKHDEARSRAEEANLAKSRFLATMSHELRTPLNAILGFSEVMKSELFGTHAVAQYKEYSNDIHSSGQHLLDIINEILDLSRIEAGRYELHEEAVDLANTTDECRHMLTLRATTKSITLKTKLEPGLPKLWADERAMRQIILNLLSNAIKFTPQGGEVTIKVGWTANGGQYVSVKDTGPGIPEDELQLVQETFGRGSTAIKTAEQGTGLGLPIVKGLIDQHGGQFHLLSKLREGTEVIVTLPKERVMDVLRPVVHNAA
jgi:two-component system, cell cycle sensor histidine kinase PleC